jgi:hypothetical protein
MNTELEYRGPTETYAHRDLIHYRLSAIYVQRLRRANGDIVYRGFCASFGSVGPWHATAEGALRSLGRQLAENLLLATEATFDAHPGSELEKNDWSNHEPGRVCK